MDCLHGDCLTFLGFTFYFSYFQRTIAGSNLYANGKKSNHIQIYKKKIIVGKPFLKPLPHQNPLPHFTSPIRLKKTKQKKPNPQSIGLRSASALGFWHFTQPAPHYAAKISFTRPEVSKVSLHICSLETTPYPTTPTPPTPPVPTRASVQCWRWLVTWPSALCHHSSASDSGSDGPVCLSGLGIIFLLYIYIYIKIEKYAHAL